MFGDSSADLEGLANLLRVDVSELLALTYPRPASKDARTDYIFFGQRVQQYMIRPDRPKICPECLSEAAYSRRIWELSLVTACPKHSRLLVEHCPGCNRRIKWIRGQVCVCGCGFDWREAIPSARLQPEELALTKYIHHLSGLEAVLEGAVQQTPSNPLLTLSLRDVVSAVTFIASRCKGVSCSTGRYLTRTARNNGLHEDFVKAYWVFEDWPTRYYEFLKQNQLHVRKSNKRTTRRPATLKESFGGVYSGLYTTLAAPQFNFMRAAFASYAINCWRRQGITSLPQAGTSSPYLLQLDGKYVTKTEARRLLEVSGRYITYLVETRQIQPLVYERKAAKPLCLIEISSLAEKKRMFDQSISMNDVADRLKVPPAVVLELVSNGCLKALRGPIEDGYREWRFMPHTAEWLLKEIKRRLCPAVRASNAPRSTAATLDAGDTCFSLVERMHGRAQANVGGLVRAVLDGFIRPCEEIQTDEGLRRFRFDLKALRLYEASEGMRGDNCITDGVTDEQWSLIKHLLWEPPHKAEMDYYDPCWNSRLVLAGIWWVLRNGADWTALPGRFPPSWTCYQWMQTWMYHCALRRAIDTLARDLQERGCVDHTQFVYDGYELRIKGAHSGHDLPEELRASHSWQRQTLLVILSFTKHLHLHHLHTFVAD
jgi:transposase